MYIAKDTNQTRGGDMPLGLSIRLSDPYWQHPKLNSAETLFEQGDFEKAADLFLAYSINARSDYEAARGYVNAVRCYLELMKELHDKWQVISIFTKAWNLLHKANVIRYSDHEDIKLDIEKTMKDLLETVSKVFE